MQKIKTKKKKAIKKYTYNPPNNLKGICVHISNFNTVQRPELELLPFKYPAILESIISQAV